MRLWRATVFGVLFFAGLWVSDARLLASDDAAVSFSLLNGTITKEEMGRTNAIADGDRISVFLEVEGNLLWVRVRTEPSGVASLCLAGRSNVTVLHASAALGMLRYKHVDDDWVRRGEFDWEMRDGLASDEAVAARQQYFEKHGWVATTASMGDPGEFEFLIQRDRFPDGGARLAVGVMPTESPNEVFGFPPATVGDCARDALVKGPAPADGMHFDSGDWIKIPKLR